MHPVIRISCFLIFAVFLARANLGQFLAAVILMLLYVFLLADLKPAKLIRSVWRLRWLFLSILIVYLWLTPGVHVMLGGLISLNLTGLSEGLFRCGILALLVITAQAIISDLAPTQLYASLSWMITPLKWLRMPVDKFVLRLALTLQAVKQWQEQPVPASKSESPANTHLWDRILAPLEGRFKEALLKANSMELNEVSVESLDHPGLLQWLYPVILTCIFLFLGYNEIVF